MKTVYLDYAATAPLDDEVLACMLPFFGAQYGNPSSMYASGRRAARAIADARERVAACIGAHTDEIIFTGSGTESDNFAVIGAARANRQNGKHIIISAIEHKAVLEAAHTLEKDGFEVSIASVDRFGMIVVSSVVSLVRDDTVLISVMYANNELGVVEPISELSHAIAERKKKTGLPLVHTDACQAAGYVALNVRDLGVDLMTLNGSKVYGPKGVGALYKKRGVHMSPLLVGGDQEGGMRAGTESVPLMVGMAFALEKAEKIRVKESERLYALRSYFISELRGRVPGVTVNSHPTHCLPHIVHVTVPGIEGESMVLMLDECGVETATGSACSAHDLKPSHVLIAIGQNDDLMHGSLRFSLGRQTDQAALDYVLSVFPTIVETLRAASALTPTLNVSMREARREAPSAQ
ncbi:hypothetical protein A2673_00285 [Candidatus Kaiserbacteria bacterium RIFCSPHIGHO2_01_FULL_50_13]|uniref:Aminotransferase class V domain-containing protein n=1 Tax=Candidatus Kaiserbacteria bacterium RIFCSPLOWO2_01_FULL_50_24 TaxID=1798507 RepID=A0A1F6EJ01_9BACT|nr:MAG: hypothetical protein A2673_00285 [Candidatus Kaiserbacteria bacterium RIFCSPHIGHO2_01_FULL_50_13]OGG73619.1 MAG: hypothetical protein A3A34_03005 [Candidatus Kaiserbacteria bacterium RIFCSPLOWO2_01_FULL_50_24]OGG81281.1 MAG: hypothetical protein A3H74_03875 [Candidatus Kaiserbacteria bacterium RIFCSPLOWO2_02_FULL_51_13]